MPTFADENGRHLGTGTRRSGTAITDVTNYVAFTGLTAPLWLGTLCSNSSVPSRSETQRHRGHGDITICRRPAHESPHPNPLPEYGRGRLFRKRGP